MPDISRSKVNHEIDFGQLIEYDMCGAFLRKSCKKQGQVTSCRPLLFFQKIYEIKASSQYLSFNIFS